MSDSLSEKEFATGKRRWVCLLSTRQIIPPLDPTDSLPDQTLLTNTRQVYANILPVGSAAYINGVQTSFDYTHRIIIRWCADMDLFSIITRNMTMPNGSTVVETFKILRYMENDGRKRFLILETVLEKRVK